MSAASHTSMARHALDTAALGRAIAAAQTRYGWTTKHLSERLAVNPRTVKRLLNGDGAPKADVLITVLVWLGMPAYRFARDNGADKGDA